MMSRRRMVFQLTSLLDLLLVVLFAQYIESVESTTGAIAAESARREQAVRLKDTALADRARLTDQLAALQSETTRLRDDLADARAKIRAEESQNVEQQKRLAEQFDAIGQIVKRQLNINPDSLKKYVEAATPADRDRLLQSLQDLQKSSTAAVIQHLRTTNEFLKLADVWEVHVYDDNSVRVRIDGKDKAKFYVNSAEQFANRFIEIVRQEGEPKSLVVALVTWSNAERWAREGVMQGVQDAATQLRASWGPNNLKRIEVARLGYSPEAP